MALSQLSSFVCGLPLAVLWVLAVVFASPVTAAQSAPAPAFPRAGAFVVETLAGEQLEGRLLAWDGDTLTVTLTAGGQRRVATADLLLLTAAQALPVPADRQPDLLVLADGAGGRVGDRLWGRLHGGDTFGVRFSVEGSAPFGVPFERIGRLLPRVARPVDQLMRLQGAGRDDRVWRALPDGGLDGPTGVVERVSDENVVLDGALGPLAFPLDELLAVVFGDTEGSDAEPPGLPVLVRLRDGTRLTAGLLALDDRRLVLATQLVERLELPLETLTSLLVRSPRVVLLADLDPVAVEQWPSIGTPQDFLFPYRRELSVTGRVLSVAGVPRASGLGVHANARLTFEVPAGATTLRVGVGLVDETAQLPARGTVAFSIRAAAAGAGAKSATLADSGTLTEGGPPAVLRAEGLPAGGRVELLCTDGGDDDAGDRAAWFDGVFLLEDKTR